MTPLRAELEAALQPHGLQMRGGFAAQSSDCLEPLPDGQTIASVWMVGVVGSALWPHFKASNFYADGLPDPLDRWSQSIGDALAQRLGGRALYPSDGPPYHPFQQWADRAEPLQPSVMMLRIHPEFGLWHAYRFALALPHPFVGAASDGEGAPTAKSSMGPVTATGPSTSVLASPGLCTSCDGQPCLGACPVGAYSAPGFDLGACATHLHSGAGQECLQSGCLARRACPVGPQFRYEPEHAAFHMRAFASARKPV
jgi:ferredoxin